MVLGLLFSDAHDDVALEERSILEIAPGTWDDDTPEKLDSRAINFESYVKTGGAPEDFRDSSYSHQYIDLQSDDSYTRALDTVYQGVRERIEASPEMQALLDKDSWSREDRVSWERNLSTYINEEHADIKGLSTYRNNSDTEKYEDTETRAVRLNDLASDIDQNTVAIEHDCESMAIFEGYLLQRIENEYLPDSAETGDYKTASDYFYVVGRTNFELGRSGEDSLHAYIVSPTTMNVIEATRVSGDPYKENTNPDMTFEDFINGEMIINDDTSIYSGRHHTLEDFTKVRFENGEISVDSVYENIPDKQSLDEEEFANAPPEAQVLIDLKAQIVEAESLRDWGCDPSSLDIDDKAQTLRERFSETVTEMVEDASIHEAMNFASDKNMQAPSRLSVEDLEVYVREMNPEKTDFQIKKALFDIDVGTIPEMAERGIRSHDEFLNLKAEENFSAANPDMNYEESRSAFGSSANNMRLQEYYRGEVSREDVTSEPDTAMALAYSEAHIKANQDYPKPSSALAYAKVDERIEVFMEEYSDFKNSALCREMDQPQNDGIYIQP